MTKLDVRLERDGLRGRSFLLGNKAGFSVSLPVASGTSSALLHGHKWFGAHNHGRKFWEGQVVRLPSRRELLSGRQQVAFTMSLTSAQREYLVDGEACRESFFVADGIQGLASELTGDFDFLVEPEFDMRWNRALGHSTENYEVEMIDKGVVVSNRLPSGRFDDLTEMFEADDSEEGIRVYAALQVVGDGASCELVPDRQRTRKKVFRKDQQRRRFLIGSLDPEAADHAPLWNQNMSYVFAPVRLAVRGYGRILYGFGTSREEALAQLAALRENLIAFEAQKTESALNTLERARFETGSHRVDTAYTQVLTRLMDALVVHGEPGEGGLDSTPSMILAGNQYFHESWKRDENIALGFLLSLGFYDIARGVIADTWRLQDEATGRLPQRIRPGESVPYHSSDATLWALWRLYQYWLCTGDDSLLYEKLPLVQRFFEASLDRVIRGLLPSGRTSAPEYLWETWMDTPHTPRHGFPIEIEMLWISCLRVFRPILRPLNPELEERMERTEAEAWRSLQAYNVRGMPADSLDEEGEARDLITPNPYFSFAVGLDLGCETEQAMRDVGRRQLAGRQGIKTLAPEDWSRVFTPEFLANRRNVRGRRMRSIGKFNYHRGVEWNWLAQFFVQAELKYGDADIAFRKYLARQVDAAIDSGGIGGISELFDLSGARGPDFQAWSMAGFLAALHAFAGVYVDVPARRILVEPQLPSDWKQLSVRKWYGRVPFDINCSGDTNYRSLSIEFPWGEAPDADIEISLVLPPGRKSERTSVLADGEQIDPLWKTEVLTGTHRLRLSTTLPPAKQIEVAAMLRRTALRLQKTA